MDSGSLIGWVVEMAAVSFAASFVLHGLIGRIPVPGILIAGLGPAAGSIGMQLARSYSSDLGWFVAIMAGLGAVGGLFGALIGGSLGVGLRRFATTFRH